MMCECSLKDEYKGNDASIFEQMSLQEIRVDAYNWKTLYQCKECSTYWEETYAEGRFGGTPVLRRVEKSYVESVWGLNHI